MNAYGRWLLNSPQRAFVQHRYLLPTIQRLGCSLDGSRVLEIGCGRGVGMDMISRAGAKRVDGVDLDPVMVRMAQRRLHGRMLVAIADIAALPMPAESYDVVVDFGAIHLMPRWRAAIAEVARVLRPGGRFAFEQPAHPLYRLLMPISTGRRITGGFGRKAFLAELDRQGMRVAALAGPHPLAASGMLGDLIGVAVKRL